MKIDIAIRILREMQLNYKLQIPFEVPDIEFVLKEILNEI